jgi:uncharacterized repeat protein (TIGR03837 family)
MANANPHRAGSELHADIPHWDIFCRVVDNFGDIGVCWRLAVQLARRGHVVRLFTDDLSALRWMAPDGCPGVTVLGARHPPAPYAPADVIVDAFGADLPPAVVEAVARRNGAGGRAVAWINLEYLSAEPYAAASHGLASPVHGGAAAGVHKWFFFPGFAPGTGGLLREPDLAQRQARFDRPGWLGSLGSVYHGQRRISLFCYEPAVLAPWLLALAGQAVHRPVEVLIAHGRPQAAVQAALGRLPVGWNSGARVTLRNLPALAQHDFDHLLWSADVNFVRGEDSLVRAIWAGLPFVWQIYPQEDRAHHAKLAAFLDILDGPVAGDLGHYFRWWNGIAPGPAPELQEGCWQAAFAALRARLLAQDDLVTRLLRFVAENR